jgi:hypothetical protein
MKFIKIVSFISIWAWHDVEPKDVGFGSSSNPNIWIWPKKNIYPSEFFFSLLALLEYNSHKNPDSSHGLAISKKVY